MFQRLLRVIRFILRPLPVLPDVVDIIIVALILFGLPSLVGGLVTPFRGAVSGVTGGLATMFGIGVLLSVLAAYRLRETIDVLEERPAPRLVLDKHQSIAKTWMHTGVTPPVLLGRLHMAQAVFRNNPRVLENEARAEGVVAHVTYYDLSGNTRIVKNSVYGRWEGNHRPVAGADNRHLLPVDFDINGIPQMLTVAVKFEQDQYPYAWDNELPQDDNLRRWPGYMITVNPFRVEIELRGNRVRGVWWVLVRNNGVGGTLEIEPIGPP